MEGEGCICQIHTNVQIQPDPITQQAKGRRSETTALFFTHAETHGFCQIIVILHNAAL